MFNLTEDQIKEELEKSKGRKNFAGPIFSKVFYGEDGSKNVGQFRHVFQGELALTLDEDHPEDDGFYNPLLRTELIMGNTRAYNNQIPQAEFQRNKKSKTAL